MPDAPTIDTGHGFVRDNGKVTLGGKCRAGSTVKVQVDGHDAAGSPVTCSTGGTWEVKVPIETGEHDILVKDEFGENSEHVTVTDPGMNG